MTYVIHCITFVHMKEQSIIVRVDDKTKENLMKLAKDNKREFSDYMRLLYEYAIEKKMKF